MVRTVSAAAASFAAILALRRFGIAIDAIIKMIPTTTRSSINENPLVDVPAPDSFLWISMFGIAIPAFALIQQRPEHLPPFPWLALKRGAKRTTRGHSHRINLVFTGHRAVLKLHVLATK
jgi:hypothetical protein